MRETLICRLSNDSARTLMESLPGSTEKEVGVEEG